VTINLVELQVLDNRITLQCNLNVTDKSVHVQSLIKLLELV
jgi:hypothetical protein